MAFFSYYLLHTLLALAVLLVFFYLIKQAIKNANIYIKLICIASFFILSNMPLGKYGLGLFNIIQVTYHYQNCEADFRVNNTPLEHKWKTKADLLSTFDVWKEQYHKKTIEDTLYRTFDFKWWMFWEYYTYYTTDIYQLPLLPKDCKKDVL